MERNVDGGMIERKDDAEERIGGRVCGEEEWKIG